MIKKITGIVLAIMLTAALAACSRAEQTQMETTATQAATQTATQAATQTATQATTQTETKSEENADFDAIITTANVTSNGVIDASTLFTERDLIQNADLSEATNCTVKDNENISITKKGVYVLTGSASNVTVSVEVEDSEKVQIVLDNVSITNTSSPAIYIKNADKVFITTAKGSENTLTVSGTFTADGDTNTDAVIFSKDDLVLNGLGTLNISSSENGVSSKDDLKITGGNVSITSASDALEANDSIAIADGNITVNSRKDALHAENDEDNTQGYIYICGGTLNLTASSDGIQATTVTQIDGGEISVTSSEGIEGTYVQINGGNISVSATDDGINGSNKSSAYTVTVEFNGGYTTVNMGQGDTDAVDSNGNLFINGGTIDITAQSAFDYDGEAKKTGGTIIVNGEETNEITNQMMGGPGGMGGGFGGGFGH